MDQERINRIMEIADALWLSNGKNAAGASTGELAAAAVLCGRLDWAGYNRPDGRVAIYQLYNRISDWWPGLIDLADDWLPPDNEEGRSS